MRNLLDFILVAAFMAAIIGLGVFLNWIVALNYDFFAGVFFTALFWALIAAGRAIMRRN
jgi:hypothetical protein